MMDLCRFYGTNIKSGHYPTRKPKHERKDDRYTSLMSEFLMRKINFGGGKKLQNVAAFNTKTGL